jgi:uncharacterized membrane-anchored protein YjiN (DUF445 family)
LFVANRKNRGFISFVEGHKGDVALALSLLLYLLSWPLGLFDHSAGDVVRAAGEASLVGGLCDYIALNMIFERHWYLPNSGVLPRNREKLIDGIANTIEREWLTPAMIGRKLDEMKVLDRLGDYLKGASLKTMVRSEQLERLCHEAARYLEPDIVTPFLHRMTSRIRAVRALDRVRLALARAVIGKICDRARAMVLDLPHSDQLIAAADETIHDLGANLRDEQGAIRKTADHWMEALVREVVIASRGEIARMVKENLGRLSDEAIRIQIESRTRTHLDWIRVNGGVFGAILGCMFALISAAHRDYQVLTRLVGF